MMKKSQQNTDINSRRREKSRIERLQKNARFGEIVFTKHGIYEARPCVKCGMHHRVFYPSVMMHCEAESDGYVSKNVDQSGQPKILSPDPNSELGSPCHSRSDLGNKKQPKSIFRGTHSAMQYLSAFKCTNMNFLQSQTAAHPSISITSTTYPRYSKHRRHEDSSIEGSNTSLEAREEGLQDNSCEICLLAEENKLYHMNYRSGKGEIHQHDMKGGGGSFVQGTVKCPTCSHWMCFQADNEEEIEKRVKMEMLSQEEDHLRERLTRGREHYRITLL